MIRLIIFDLDGTLVDSSVDIMNALNYAIGPYGLERLTPAKTVEMVGEGLTRLVEKILGPDRMEIRTPVLDRFLEYYTAHLSDFTVPYPGMEETLKRLSHYKKAVLSNKREFLSKRLLEELGLAKYFDLILGSDSVDEKKPSPKPVLQILNMLTVRPGEAVIVGDSNFDIEAGHAAGIKAIAVSYGFREAALLHEADAIIDHISDLVAKLDEFGRQENPV